MEFNDIIALVNEKLNKAPIACLHFNCFPFSIEMYNIAVFLIYFRTVGEYIAVKVKKLKDSTVLHFLFPLYFLDFDSTKAK